MLFAQTRRLLRALSVCAGQRPKPTISGGTYTSYLLIAGLMDDGNEPRYGRTAPTETETSNPIYAHD